MEQFGFVEQFGLGTGVTVWGHVEQFGLGTCGTVLVGDCGTV